MRLSERNKQTVWYSNYSTSSEIIDSNSNYTGEHEVIYAKPTKTALNINTVDSDIEVAMFGVDSVDVIVLLSNRKDCPLAETSVLWYGIIPQVEKDGTTKTPHNYNIVGIRTSLNTVRIYAKKVDLGQVVVNDDQSPLG